MASGDERIVNEDRVIQTRRNIIGAALTGLVSALLIAVLWLISRGAPSAGRDPAWPPPGT